ncbi:MAG: redox-regulated ATPase YchF [Syntrophales bacterium]
MGFRCGIIGLPNVGKSTIFNALTAAGAAVANYPFCTIDPNVGIVAVPDKRLEKIAGIIHPPKITHTTMEFLDIAGLVRGASRGEGLGNKFLGNIREVDAVVHIVRCFENPDVAHIEGAIDPIRDIEVVNMELILADLETVEHRIEKMERQSKVGDKSAGKELDLCLLIRDALGRGIPVRKLHFDEEFHSIVHSLFLLTSKKVLYVANIGEAALKKNSPLIDALKSYVENEGSGVVVICGNLEAEIAELPAEEQEAYLTDLGIEESGLEKLIREGYKLLGLITFYTTVGPELRAWTIPNGTRAPVAAGKIHSDMERGFIRAEIIHYNDFIREASWQSAREKGLIRSEGKDYVMKDGDITLFRFNV